MSNSRVTPVIDVAIAHFKQHRSMREELERTRASLNERKLIDRAKGVIMKQKPCSEDEAFAMLRRVAMDQKKRIGQAAADVAQLADLFNSPPARKEVKS